LTQTADNQDALDEVLTAKIAAMDTAQRDDRVAELYSLPHTPENELELIKLLFGEK
jgi:hypothetical protein